MKYLLVIGAGINQLPIIKAAKTIGCYVYVVTVAGDYPGIELADEWIEKSIFEKEEIVELFSNGKKPIDGVISDQSDMAVPIVAYIAEKLDLPTWGYENALYFTDKAKMREIIQKVGLPSPENISVSSVSEAIDAVSVIGLPVVIKPTDSFSSRGITLVREINKIEEAYKIAYDNSRVHGVVVEKYISGKQYFSQGFVSNYILNMYAFSDRYYYDLPNLFIPYTNAFPAQITHKLKKRMVSDFERITNELKPRFGHVWAEWILDDMTDELFIVEIAIRGGGAYVTTDLIPLAYGIDTQPLLIREALGEDTRFYNFKDFSNKSAAFFSFLLPEGKIISIKGLEEANKIPGVVRTDYKPMKVGDYTGKIENKSSRYGLIIVHGDTRDDIYMVWKHLIQTIDVKVKTNRGIENAIWE